MTAEMSHRMECACSAAIEQSSGFKLVFQVLRVLAPTMTWLVARYTELGPAKL